MNATATTSRRTLARAVAATGVALACVSAYQSVAPDTTPSRVKATQSSSSADTGHHVTVAKDKGHVSSTQKGMPPLSAKAKRRSDAGMLPGEPRVRPRAGDGENEASVSPSATSTNQLQWHGGWTQTAPRIYLVFWGANWFTGGDPDGVANRAHYFYQGLGTSTYLNVLKQYTQGGTFTTATYKGWMQDTTALPSSPSMAQMAAAARRAATRVNDFGSNAQYVIMLPYGVVDSYSLQSGVLKACGWHAYASTSTTNWFTYTALPYSPYLSDKFHTCGAYSVNGSVGRLDGVTIVAAHEMVETVNDPGLNAWTDVNGQENGDKCSWLNLRNYTLTNGKSFPVQPYWSNQFRNTYGSGCLYT